MSTLYAKMKNFQKDATVRAYLKGEEAEQKSSQAGRLERKKDKTEKEAATVREIRKEAATLRQEQEQARALGRNMGLGEKILRAYFTYKMAGLACRTLVGLVSPSRDEAAGRAIGAAVTAKIDSINEHYQDVSDRLADGTADGKDLNELRAEQIEQALASFESISKEAQEQGITQDGRPLLEDADREKMQELASISRDADDPQQAERYAAKCQELGLDYNEALNAFRQDRTFDDLQRDAQKEQEKTFEQENDYSLEI